jgi:hypothetical protein
MNLQEQTNRIRQMMGIVTEQEVPACQQEAERELTNAIKKWSDWLNNPITKQKFMSNHGLDEKKTEEIYQKYNQLLKEIKVFTYDKTYEFTDFTNTNLSQVAKKKGKSVNGFVFRNFPTSVFINCDRRLQDREISETLHHEISHLLDFIHPKNPEQKIDDLHDNHEIYKHLDKDSLDNFFLKSNITDRKTKRKIRDKYFPLFRTSKKDKQYLCLGTELLNGIQGLRDALGKKPGEDITVQEAIPFFTLLNDKTTDSDINKMVYCWVLKGLPDLDNYIKELNSFAKNNQQQSSNQTQQNQNQV